MNTNQIAIQYRLQEWTEMIRECRSSGLPVAEWCTQNGITKANYYYRLRRVRQACLEQVSHPVIAPVPQTFPETTLPPVVPGPDTIRIMIRDVSLEITETTSEALLGRVLRVIRNAE